METLKFNGIQSETSPTFNPFDSDFFFRSDFISSNSIIKPKRKKFT